MAFNQIIKEFENCGWILTASPNDRKCHYTNRYIFL